MTRNSLSGTMKMLSAFILSVLLLFPAGTFDSQAQDEEKPITHNVSVSVMLLPVFVTGPDGAPVFDLKKEDFELSANGISMPIQQFIRFDFQHEEEVQEEIIVKGKPVKIKSPSRAIFVIIDGVFTSFHGYRRSKKIAEDIIKRSPPGDIFIVLENTGGGGVRYIGGPGDSRKKLVAKIKKLRVPHAKWDKSLYWSQEWNPYADNDANDPVHSAAVFENLARGRKDAQRMAYRNQIRHMGDVLAKFKFALKTVTRPKVLFLISEGMARGAFKAYQSSGAAGGYGSFGSALTRTPDPSIAASGPRDRNMFRYLENMVKAINAGGSVIYTVNPGRFSRDNEASGEMSLRYLAFQSGGDYIAGSDTKKIITKIKRTTAAYYELAFAPIADLGKNFKVDLKCKRKGVTVNTFKNTEVNKPYYRMEPLEKKIFALNMATGGSWSRLMGKVVRVRYHRMGKRGEKTQDTVRVPLPPKMQNKELDIFSVRLDRKSRKVEIDMITRKTGDTADLVLKADKDIASFFVIIEPVFAYCIYNRV